MRFLAKWAWEVLKALVGGWGQRDLGLRDQRQVDKLRGRGGKNLILSGIHVEFSRWCSRFFKRRDSIVWEITTSMK